MRHIDIHKIADGATFNRFHGALLLWCAIIIICDGYDLAVAGIAVPSIMKDMGVTAQNAGFMVSSALFGMMFGAITLGTLADRIGRRWAIAICIGLFSVFTAAAGFTHDPYVFSAMRFLAGLGIAVRALVWNSTRSMAITAGRWSRSSERRSACRSARRSGTSAAGSVRRTPAATARDRPRPSPSTTP